MDYVLGIITSFTSFNAKEATLKVRGQAITTAVAAFEITRRRFIGTEHRQNHHRN